MTSVSTDFNYLSLGGSTSGLWLIAALLLSAPQLEDCFFDLSLPSPSSQGLISKGTLLCPPPTAHHNYVLPWILRVNCDVEIEVIS